MVLQMLPEKSVSSRKVLLKLTAEYILNYYLGKDEGRHVLSVRQPKFVSERKLRFLARYSTRQEDFGGFQTLQATYDSNIQNSGLGL